MLSVVAGWMGDHSQKATLAENLYSLERITMADDKNVK